MTEPTAKKSGFNQSIHGLRGVASLMVFFAHISFGYYDHFHNDNAVMAVVMRHVANFGTYGVELFFLISGYVITGSCMKYSPGEFFGRRFWRLYPLFFCFTMLFFVMNMVIDYRPEVQGIGNLVSNLLFLDLFLGTPALSPNAWSITYEICYYIASYAIIWSLLKSQKIKIVPACAAIIFALYMIAAYDITIYYVIGVALYFLIKHKGGAIGAHSRLILPIAVIGIIIIAAMQDFGNVSYVEEEGKRLLSLGLILATAVFAFSLLVQRSSLNAVLETRLFTFMGTISYSLYLAHPYCYFVIREIGKKIGLSDYAWQITYPLYLVANTVLAISASYIIHRLIEVLPYKMIYGDKVYGK